MSRDQILVTIARSVGRTEAEVKALRSEITPRLASLEDTVNALQRHSDYQKGRRRLITVLVGMAGGIIGAIFGSKP